MNKIYIRDCVICGKYIAIKSIQGRSPKVSQFVPVVSRKKNFKTCSNQCSKENHRNNIYRNNKSRKIGVDKGEVLNHMVNLEINYRVLRSRIKFKEFCKENNIIYNGN